jgi:uncharacterized protein HemX
MDTTTLIGLTATLLAVAAGGLFWWRQRQRLARLQGLLREAEDSRLELMDEAQALRRQIRASSPTSAPRPAADIEERKATLDRALSDAQPRPAGAWQDTMPMNFNVRASGFLPTQPAPLATQPAELARD